MKMKTKINIIFSLLFLMTLNVGCQAQHPTKHPDHNHLTYLDTIVDYDVQNNYEEYVYHCNTELIKDKKGDIFIRRCTFPNKKKGAYFYYLHVDHTGYFEYYNKQGHLRKTIVFDLNKPNNTMVLYDQEGVVKEIKAISTVELLPRLEKKFSGKKLYSRICAYFMNKN